MTNADTASSDSNKMPATVNENRCAQKEISEDKLENRTRISCVQQHTNDDSPILRNFCITVQGRLEEYCATCIDSALRGDGRGKEQVRRKYDLMSV